MFVRGNGRWVHLHGTVAGNGACGSAAASWSLHLFFVQKMNERKKMEDKFIGEGTHGRVILHRVGDTWIATKRIRRTEADRSMSVTALREIDALKTLRGHPHIVNLTEVRISDEHLFISMEYSPCTLRSLMGRSRLTQDSARGYMSDLCKGLAHCHQNDWMHRDIKPENLLVDPKNVVRITDFGLSRRSQMTTDVSPVAYTPQMVTLWYRSSEVLQNKPYSFGIDVWSAGCVLFEMLSGDPLFRADSELGMLKAISAVVDDENAWLTRVSSLDGQHAKLVRDCIARDPIRISAQKILQKRAEYGLG